MKHHGKIRKKSIALLLLTAFFTSLFPPLPAFAADTVYIANAADLMDLGKNCAVDTWSQNKIVELTSDIDLSALDFTPIPSFGGIFRGNGHTISGLHLTAKGSYQGLFRYIQESGKVENLTVCGTIIPDGNAKYLGGIAGENNGAINYCTFQGTIIGKSDIGGIAGLCSETGSISHSSASGNFLGENYTGGIAGQNFGTITNCQNNANVNTEPTDNKKSLSNLEPDGEIDLSAIRSTENISANTDTGGIAGYSKGTITDCKNYGNIGYQHIGYNTGGICGRQAGIITNCENNGIIYGRKDVGGICGQAEPYIVQAYSKDVLQQINDTMRSAQSTLSNALNRSDHEITDTLNSINNQLGNISDAADHMTDSALDYGDTVISDTNDFLKKISSSLDYIEKGLERISTSTVRLGTGIVEIEEAGDAFLKYLRDVATDVKKTNQDNNQTDDNQTEENQIEENINQTETILQFLEQQDTVSGNETINELLAQLGITAEQIAAIKATIDTIQNQLPELGKDLDPAALQEIIKKIRDSLQTLEQQLQALKNTLGKTTTAIEAMKKHAPELGKALDSLEDGLYDIERGMDYLTMGTTELTRAIRVINNGDTLQIPEIDNTFKNNIDTVQSSLDAIQNDVTRLNQTVSNTQDDITKDLLTLNGQFLQILNSLTDAYNRQQSDEREIIEDLSDKNTTNISQGKIALCQNNGIVQADINTGGIVGVMAIEYDFDPEDDVTKQGNTSLRFTYQTKAVIEKCGNYGVITGKKNYVGSIVGKMDLGTVLLCEGYGDAESTDGSFVGGIAGASEGFIRNSVAKCTLAGENFVGGITGQGETITGCYALAHISRAEENKGAIVGTDSEEKKDIAGNYFVGDNIGGIDGISYQGRAENTNITNFCDFVEKKFHHPVSFRLTYMADDTIVATLPYTYGEPIDQARVPAVPEKTGYFGTWSNYNYDMPLFDTIITAEYERSIEILPSPLKRDGKAILLICGSFDNQAQIAIAENETENKILGKRILNSYRVTITEHTPKGSYQIRYLPEKKNSGIIIACGDTIEKVSAKPFGRYLECTAPGQEFILYEVPPTGYLWVYGMLALLLIGGGYGLYKKNYRRKTAENQSQETALAKPTPIK